MNAYAAMTTSDTESESPSDRSDRFYSVELPINELNLLYQFKIWEHASETIFVLIKENSEILSQLQVGKVFNMKYYSTDSVCPTVRLKTQIKQITKNDQGRFKGHYRVGLAIL